MRSKKRGRQTLTIHDVANYANVSAMTVSNVINGRGAMTDATRQAVLLAIETLGYQPNRAAQSLARAQTLRIGFVHPNLHNAFLSGILVGALQASSLVGAHLALRITPDRALESLHATIDSLVANGAKGIMVTPPYAEILEHSLLLAELAKLDIPVVAVAPGRKLAGMMSVRVDDGPAATAAVNRLIDLGHRRIGLVTGPAEHSSAQARADGYRAALLARGIPIDPSLTVPGTFEFASSMEAIRSLLERPDPPTAVFASNDTMAVAVIMLANQLDIAVPRQLAVAGFDDSELASQVWPALTTVRQPVQQMARTAIAMLLEGIAGHAVEQDCILPFELVIRGSA